MSRYPVFTAPHVFADFRRWLHGALALAAASLSFASLPASAQSWVPNETQAAVQTDLIDYEFSQQRGMLAWNDCCGSLWIAKVDMVTGKFSPFDGKGLLIDPDSMTFQDAQKTKNGPEWVSALGGDLLVYTKYAGKHTDGNSRIGYARPVTPSSSCSYISADGYWCAGDLGPETTRKAPYGSKVDNDPAPRISYVDNKEVHYWRELLNANTEQTIPDFPDSNYPVRHVICSDPTVPGTRAVLYPVIDPSTGIQQIFYRDFDTGKVTQMTDDDGTKYEVWMWCAPEFNNELVFFTLVNENEVRVYRNLPTGKNGAKKWTAIFDQIAPTGNQIYSPEPFVWNGKSYFFMAQTVKPNKFRSEVWISNIDPAAPVFKRITPSNPVVTRTDPEVFITNSGPKIYYNMLQPDVTSSGRQKPCRDPNCSLGVWFAEPGL